MSANAMFAMENVTGGYGRTPVVTELSAGVDRGRILAFVGPNGAGKSTLLKAIFGLLPMMRGTVTLEGDRLSGLPPEAIARRGVSYVPQVDNVFPTMSVRENLEMGAFASGADFRAGAAYVYELFPDLLAAERKQAGQLSGGQRIMLAVGRGLMAQPTVLLLDEPTAGLSPLYGDRVWGLIRRVADDGRAVVVVEQNVGLALRGCDAMQVIVDGRTKLVTNPLEITEERLGQVFLGVD